MDRIRRVAGAAVLALLVTSCGSPAAEPPRHVTRTVTASPSPAGPSESPSSAPKDQPTEPVPSYPSPAVDDAAGAVPAALVGTWQSLDQGSAEDLIEIHADGSYLRAMVLMQQRPSGMFSLLDRHQGERRGAGDDPAPAPTRARSH